MLVIKLVDDLLKYRGVIIWWNRTQMSVSVSGRTSYHSLKAVERKIVEARPTCGEFRILRLKRFYFKL